MLIRRGSAQTGMLDAWAFNIKDSLTPHTTQQLQLFYCNQLPLLWTCKENIMSLWVSLNKLPCKLTQCQVLACGTVFCILLAQHESILIPRHANQTIEFHSNYLCRTSSRVFAWFMHKWRCRDRYIVRSWHIYCYVPGSSCLSKKRVKCTVHFFLKKIISRLYLTPRGFY